jgi:flagellar biosynthesis anti-sigma factor FlgM
VNSGKHLGSRPVAEDTTSLSSNSGSVNALTQQALQPSPTRAERVTALKQAVSSSEYKLDAGKIADALANSQI